MTNIDAAPLTVPITVLTPALKLYLNVLATMTDTDGPGTIMNSITVNMNGIYVVILIIDF